MGEGAGARGLSAWAVGLTGWQGAAGLLGAAGFRVPDPGMTGGDVGGGVALSAGGGWVNGVAGCAGFVGCCWVPAADAGMTGG